MSRRSWRRHESTPALSVAPRKRKHREGPTSRCSWPIRQLVVIVRQTELERSDKDRANEEKRGTDRDEA